MLLLLSFVICFALSPRISSFSSAINTDFYLYNIKMIRKLSPISHGKHNKNLNKTPTHARTHTQTRMRCHFGTYWHFTRRFKIRWNAISINQKVQSNIDREKSKSMPEHRHQYVNLSLEYMFFPSSEQHSCLACYFLYVFVDFFFCSLLLFVINWPLQVWNF